MKGGVDLQKYVGLLVTGPAKMKIIHGEGPINLVGSHCVEYFGYREDDDEEILVYFLVVFLVLAVFSILCFGIYVNNVVLVM